MRAIGRARRASARSVPQTWTTSGRPVASAGITDGSQWADGSYKLSAVGKDSNGKDVSVSTEIVGQVDSADLSASPPLLSIGGQTFTVDQIKKVVLPSASNTSSSSS